MPHDRDIGLPRQEDDLSQLDRRWKFIRLRLLRHPLLIASRANKLTPQIFQVGLATDAAELGPVCLGGSGLRREIHGFIIQRKSPEFIGGFSTQPRVLDEPWIAD
jgi:hypothetical protein